MIPEPSGTVTSPAAGTNKVSAASSPAAANAQSCIKKNIPDPPGMLASAATTGGSTAVKVLEKRLLEINLVGAATSRRS